MDECLRRINSSLGLGILHINQPVGLFLEYPPFDEPAVAGNKFVVPSDKTCMGCHGDYKAMAEKTKNLPEPNPHWSNHYGSGLSCTACHREHSQSKVYCNECHEFSYKIK